MNEDLLKTIKVQNENGSYSDPIKISTDGDYIECYNGKDLNTILRELYASISNTIDSEITFYYLASNLDRGVTTGTQGWTNSMQQMTNQKRYLWMYFSYKKIGGGIQRTDPVIIGVRGADGQTGQPGTGGVPGEGIVSTTISYGKSTSDSLEPNPWGNSMPQLSAGDWLWVRTVYTYTNGNTQTVYTKSYVGTDGQDGTSVYVESTSKVGDITTVTFTDGTSITIADGQDGANGTPGENGYVHIAWATSADGSQGFSTTVSEGKTYIGVYTDNTEPDSLNYLSYNWSLIKGADGRDGTGINSTVITYGRSDSSATEPQEWFSTVPPLSQGDWLWVKTVYTYSNNNTYITYNKSYIGTDGQDGDSVYIQSSSKSNGVTTVTFTDGTTLQIVDGQDGTDGTNGENGYVHIAWATSADGSQGFSTSVSTNKTYIGVYTDHIQADSQTYTDYSWSLIKGADGVGITSTVITYGTSANDTTEPSNWGNSVPPLSQGDWLWTKTVYNYSDSTIKTTYTKSYIGTDGQDGDSVYIQSTSKSGNTTTVTFTDGTSIAINDGEDGDDGTPGENGYVHVAWATSADGSQGFSTSVSTDKTYIGVYTDNTQADSQTYSDYSWSLIKGADGEDGVGIDSTTILYGTSSNSSTEPTNWEGSVPTNPSPGDWLWVKTTYTYSDGDTQTTYTKSYIGTDGQDGDSVYIQSTTKSNGVTTITFTDGTTVNISDGEDGDNGTPGAPGTNSYVHFAWANSANGATDFSTSVSANKKYIGVYTDSTQADSQTYSDYSWSLIKGADAISAWCGSESQTVACTKDRAATAASTVTIPFTAYRGTTRVAASIAYSTLPSGVTLGSNTAGTASTNGSLVFNIASGATLGGTTAAYDNVAITLTITAEGQTFTQSFTLSKSITGATGASITITSTSVTYQQGTSGTVAPTGNWENSVPSVTQGNYLWTKTVVNYSDNSSTTSYSVARAGQNGTNGINGINGTNGVSPTVTSTLVEYAQSSSGASAPSSGWSQSPPSTYTAGYYMWTKTTITYSDSATAISYAVSKNGANGNDATVYYIRSSSDVIVKASTGNTLTPSSVTFTSYSQAGTGAPASYSGRFIIAESTNGSTWTNKYTSSVNESSKNYVPSSSSVKLIRCTLYKAGGTSTTYDTQTVPIVSDGTNGTNGQDAYTVILTNENHTFSGGVSAAIAANAICNVIAYKGATQVAATIGTITGQPTGMTTSITSNGTTSAYFTVTVTTSMTERNGVLTVPVTVDSKTFNMKFTYSLALKGDQGIQGNPGVSVTSVTSTNNTADGGTSVITVTLSNGDTQTFNVKNGSKGSTGPIGPTAEWYYGTALTHTSGTANATITGAVVGSMYLNTNTSLVYKCTAVSGSTMTWTYAGNLTTGVLENIDVGGTNLCAGTSAMRAGIGNFVTGTFRASGGTVSSYSFSTSDPAPMSGLTGYLRITNTGSSATRIGMAQDGRKGFVSGRTYTMSCWIRASVSGGSVTLQPLYINGAHISISAGTANTTWTYYSITGVLSGSATEADNFSLGYTYVSNIPANGGYYDVCGIKVEQGNVVTSWSPAPQDAISVVQPVYKRTNSSTAPAAPTAITTATTDQTTTGNWTKLHMPAICSTNTAYKYLWTCNQLISVGGYFVGATDVVADNGTTVIDGGNIITNTITANKLNTTDINASGVLTIGALSNTTQNDILNSNVSVGGRNLFKCLPNHPTADISVTNGVSYTYDYNTGTYQLTITVAASDAWRQIYVINDIESNISDLLGKTVTLSATSISSTRTAADPRVYFYGTKSDSTTWTRNLGKDHLTDTFTIPNNLTKIGYIIRCDQNALGSVGEVATFKGIKLQIGNTATDWSPAPEDAVFKTQSIYCRTNTNSVPAVPTTIITSTVDTGPSATTWTKMHMPAICQSNVAYKYLWTCDQLISTGGYLLGHTDVVPDNGTTVINGDTIITGTIDVNRLNVSDIISQGSIVVSGDNISLLNNDNGYQNATQVSNAVAPAAKTATNYITYIDSSGGIKVHNTGDTSDYVQINSSKISMYRNNTEKMKLTDSDFQLGDSSNYIKINNSGIQIFYGGDSVGEYGSTARVGSTDSGYTEISSSGMIIYGGNGTVQVAHLGYGLGNAESGTANAPYYTLGTRAANSAVGNYSVSEGERTESSGLCSHAEGSATVASSTCAHAEGELTVADYPYCHAEGYMTTATGPGTSHAEGSDTVASGWDSHAEGSYTVASGWWSHAQNRETIAAGECQTAIGKYNVEDTNNRYAFIIGNGSSDSARSNALAVYWNGNFEIQGSSATATLNSSYVTAGSIRAYRRGNMVQLSADVTVNALSARTGIATLPVGYRPVAVTYAFITSMNEYVVITDTGSIQFNAGAAGRRWFSAVYVYGS